MELNPDQFFIDVGDAHRERPSALPSQGRHDNALASTLYGSLLGILPYAASLLMNPSHRSPYLLAYPAVILAAWMWGLPGAVACASVSGVIIEFFLFHARQIDIAPTPTGWMARVFLFLAGSIMVGSLTRSAARQREVSATASLKQKLALAEAEREAARQREQAAELQLENEVRAHLALDGANAGLWEWDLLRNQTKWSKGFNRLHGIEHEGIGSYEIWRPRVHPQDIGRVEKELQKAISEIGTFYSEYRVQLSNGELRWVGCQGKALVGSDGKAAGMTGYCGDVTRRKLADLAIIQNEKLAIAGRLSASIAHEVNNPLAAVGNLLYLISLETLSESQIDHLDQAMQQLERVSQIANQTLKFSRSSDRGSQCKPSELIENTLRFLRHKLQSAEIEVSTEIRQDSQFLCSSGEMHQVLTNLINNSIEAMAGPGRIRIRASASVDWKNRASKGVRITVADTGSGMSSQTARRMREAFFTTKDGTGTGLGMWIVYELIEKHSGKISVGSSTNPHHHGTSISLFIPTEQQL